MEATRSPDPGDLVIRGWRHDDAVALPDLLDELPDPLWLAQSHSFHGADLDSQRWRRTVVATANGSLIGAATVIASRVHPGRWPCAVEVAPGWRRRGIGTALLTRLRSEHAQARPMSSKVRPEDVAATGFVNAVGGSVYQRCPGQRVDPSQEPVSAWAGASLQRAQRAGLQTSGLQSWSATSMAEVFAAQYRWVHEAWSPVPMTPRATAALMSVAESTAAEVDVELSSATWPSGAGGGAPLAVAFAFPGADGVVEVVAEAVQPPLRGDGAGGRASAVTAVRASVARTLVVAARRRAAVVEFDGHVDDPHLQPAIAAVPTVGSRPLLLVDDR